MSTRYESHGHKTEGDTLRVQFFSLTVSTWHICYCATIDSFCLASLQWLNKNKKTAKQKNDKTQPSATTPPLGCAICSFVFVFWCLVFFVFLVSCFLVSCFLVRCWFFEGLAKQHKSEGPRPNSLPVLPL